MLPTFTDHDLQTAFARDGYVTIPLLQPAEVTELLELWRGIGARPGQPFLSTVLDEDKGRFVVVHEALRDRCRDRLAELFDDHLLVLGHIIDKRPVDASSDAGTVPVHQDFSAVDETEARSAFVWCPLVDAVGLRAPLAVAPGSHLLSAAPRGSGAIPWLLEPFAERLRQQLVEVPVPAGTAIVYDGALVHASRPNHSGVDRPVVGIGFVPRRTALVRYHSEVADRVECFEVDTEYFLHGTLDCRPDVGVRSVRELPWTWTSPTDDVLAAHDRGSIVDCS